MEPDGSITKYYNFVTTETKDILESIMTRATTYYEFTLDLGEYICNEPASEELVFIAGAHAWRIQELPLLVRIREKYSKSPGIIAFTYPTTSLGDRLQFGEEVSKIIDDDLMTDIPDWIRVPEVTEEGCSCSRDP